MESITRRMSALEILSNACIFFTIAVFSTGIPQCWEMMKQKNTNNIPFLPYVMTSVNNMMWILYSRLIHDFTVFIVNTIGVTLQIIYIIVYLSYSKVKAKEFRMVVMAALFVILSFLYVHFQNDDPLATNLVGITCTVMTILMFSSPLAELKTAVLEKSMKSISFPLTVATFFCTGLWVTYGALISDTFLIIPNVLGLLTSLPRFYFFAKFRGEKYSPIPNTV